MFICARVLKSDLPMVDPGRGQGRRKPHAGDNITRRGASVDEASLGELRIMRKH